MRLFSLAGYRDLCRFLFNPREVYSVVEEIPVEGFYREGFRTMILDVDNTIMTYDQYMVSLNKSNWVEKVKGSGFRVFLFSNNSSKRRIKRVCEALELPGLYFTLKPFPFSLRELAEDHGIDFHTTLVVGDQLFKDVVLANLVGAHGILVDPLDKKVSLLKTVQRDVELKILRWLGRL